MGKRLSFSIAVNLLTENFRKGANTIQNSLRSIQMQIVTFAAALGVGGMGLIGLISRLKDVARETNRVLTALKNVSGGTQGFADNLRFLNQLADKYGIEVNGLTDSFTKFTASATQAGMSMDNQKKIFESLSRASTAFGLTADENKGVMLALSQMMGKGKISSEELRKQMGEKLPVAMQAMAKAAGVSMAGLEKLLQQGKLMSADILPKFADALNEMIPEISTDNLESSLGRLENVFGEFTNATGFQDKYKALVDGLTKLIKSATENIKNIIVGIVATIVFIITNSLTKVYRGYAANGQQIVANATTTHNKLRATIAARVEAEIALENAKLRYLQASGKQQIAIAREVEKAKQLLSARTTAVNAAHETAKAAAAQAAAIRSRGAWLTAYAAISGSIKSLGNALKSMWASFGPAIVISAIIALLGYMKNVYDEAKRVRNIFTDYKNEAEKITHSIEITQLEKLKSISTDVNKSLKDRQTALDVLNGILKTNYTIDSKSLLIQGDINKKIEERLGLLKAQAKVEFYTPKIVEMEDKIESLEKKKADLEKNKYKSNKTGISLAKSILGDGIVGGLGMDTVENLQKEIHQLNKVRVDANAKLEQAILDGGLINQATSTTTSGDNNLTDKGAKAAAEKRLEALRKLDEADQKRQTEKLAFDNEIRQKEIDGMVEGYDKRIGQLKLNSDKEDQAIKEFAQKAAKDQLDYAKTKYVSTSGTSTGFEDYYAKADLSKIMPEGLRPEDVTKQINALYASAKEANKKGLDQINIEISKSIIEERLQFASEMEQKIYDTENYFNERRRLVKKGSDDYFELLSLESKALESIKSQHNTKLIQMENEYKEKAVELTSELFFFQSDKDSALLRQRIESNQKYIDSLKKELKVLTGLNFDVLDEVTLSNLTKAYPDLIYAIKRAKQEQQGFNNEFARTPAQKLMEISGLFNQIVGTLGDISGLDFSMLSNAVSGIASFANGDFMGAASSGLGIVSTVVSGIIGKMERQAQIQREILKLQQDYDIALRQQNYDLISSIDYARAFKDNMEALHWLIEKGFVSDTDFSVWEELENHAKTASKNVDAARRSYDAIFGDGEKVLSSMYDDRAGLGRLDKGFLKDIEDWKNGITTTEEALKRLGARGYKGLTDIAEQIDRAKEETDKWTDSMVELSKQMDQFVTGTDLDGFLDSTMTALTNLKSGVSDLGDFTEETLKNAVLSSFKYKVLADALKPMYDRLANMFREDTLDPTDVSQWGVDLENLTKEYSDKLEAVYKSLGLDFENSKTQKASTGVSQTITEDTGSRLDGRLSAVQMSGLRMEGFLSSLSLSSSNLLNTNISIDNELKKHTSIFNEMRTIQLNTFHEIEGTGKSMKRIEEQITKVEKNTSKL
ncbi:tape measure protein [Dysgonomonas sp. GY617]|uniref:tape measure protein n=1 Tax=Dysgonomonas sp. GY617 TaxID=2780420 RepID=UPI0018847560|nr:tape measure protein [Dysgonomonas sp. GY617]MBF0577741.1 tape measure protein [Dysgonomonas sp. GY617]